MRGIRISPTTLGSRRGFDIRAPHDLDRRIKRYSTALCRCLGLFVNNITPYDRWYRQNAQLRESVDGYREHIVGVSDPQLRTTLLARFDIAQCHTHYGRYNKWIAITMLLALEHYFPVNLYEDNADRQS